MFFLLYGVFAVHSFIYLFTFDATQTKIEYEKCRYCSYYVLLLQLFSVFEGCPILRQIYALHCIVLYPHNNRLTIQYN